MNNTRKRKTRKEYEFMKQEIPRLLEQGYSMSEIAKQYDWGLSPLIVFAKKHCNYQPTRYDYNKEEIKKTYEKVITENPNISFRDFHEMYYPNLKYSNLWRIIKG